MISRIKKSILQRLSLVISDGFALVVSLIAAVYFLNLVRPGSQEYIDFNRLGLAKILGFAILCIFWQLELYTKRRPIWEEIKLLYTTIVIFAIMHFIVTFLLSHHIVKLVNVFFWCFLLVVLPVFRLITKIILLRLNLWQRNLYIVGIGKNALATYQLLRSNKMLGFITKGFIDIQDQDQLSDKLSTPTNNRLVEQIPVYPYTYLINSVVKNDGEIVFALEMEDLINNVAKIDILQTKFTFVSVVPDVLGLPLYGASIDHFFGSNQVVLRLKNNLSRRINRIIKRTTDILLSLTGIILLSPLFLVFAVLIKRSNRKVLFKHRRIGRNGQSFDCIKFQTMYDNSQQILAELLANNQNLREEWQKDFKLKHDPRVTKVGKFLRKTSLDEIPQLFNVLIGEMSLVGPRPIVEQEVSKYNNDFYYYKLVRPGVTGLWQISGRNDIDYENRVRLDVWYVKNWSLWYDFVIILKTIIVVLTRKGAY